MASPWHKHDGINTMEQKGQKAVNDTAPKGKPKGMKSGKGKGC